MKEKRSKYDGHAERGRRNKKNRRTKEIDEIIGEREEHRSQWPRGQGHEPSSPA
jgi:hypothetical protein